MKICLHAAVIMALSEGSICSTGEWGAKEKITQIGCSHRKFPQSEGRFFTFATRTKILRMTNKMLEILITYINVTNKTEGFIAVTVFKSI